VRHVHVVAERQETVGDHRDVGEGRHREFRSPLDLLVQPILPSSFRRKGRFPCGGITAPPPDLRLLPGQPDAVHPRLLAGGDPDRHPVAHERHRVGLGVPQCDHAERRVRCRPLERPRVPLLLEHHPEHVPPFPRGRFVAGIYLEDTERRVLLPCEQLARPWRVTRRDDPVRDHPAHEGREFLVDRLGHRDHVAERRFRVAIAGPHVRAGQGSHLGQAPRAAHGRVDFSRGGDTGGGDVLERRGDRGSQGARCLADELPRAQRVEDVDVGRGAAAYRQRSRVDEPCRLVGVGAVAQVHPLLLSSVCRGAPRRPMLRSALPGGTPPNASRVLQG
jgi:hypothetical protein